MADIAREMRKIVRSASGGNHECSISVEFDGKQSRYDTPEEFVEGLALTDLAHVRTVGFGLNNPFTFDPSITPARDLSANVVFYRRLKPYVAVSGDDRSIVEGVKDRLVEVLGGTRSFALPGMRLRSPEMSRIRKLGLTARTMIAVAVTAAVTATITIVITRLLDSPTPTP